MTEPEPDVRPGRDEDRGPIRRAWVFAVMTVALMLASRIVPWQEWWGVERLSEWGRSAGWAGPVWILLLGTVTPLLLLPRWPLAFVCGLLYGPVWGAALSNVASTLGALAHYAMARSLLGPWCRQWLERRRSRWRDIPPTHAFVALLLLRAFPLSSFVATNILAGSLRIPVGTYVSASFIGMMPSSILYAAWGELTRRPAPVWYAVLALVVVFLLVGTRWAQRWWWARAERRPAGSRSCSS